MGCESRLYVVDAVDLSKFREGDGYYDVLAIFNMSCIGQAFRDVFTEPLQFTLRSCEDGADVVLSEDLYGDDLRSAPIDKVVEHLEKIILTDPYRRFPPLYAFLKAIDKEQWGNLLVIQYKY